MTMLRAVLLLLSASAAHGAKRLDPHGIFCGNILCYDVLEGITDKSATHRARDG